MTLEPDEEIFQRVRDLLVETLAVAPGAVLPEARIMDDLGAESIDLLDLRFRIEKAFGFRVTAEDLQTAFALADTADKFRSQFTVGALCGYISHRLVAQRA